ncbi:MAG: glycosyltransferase family 4 protein [Armatimonadota bacterium]
MRLAHVTTSDISLALLLGHQLTAYQAAGFDVTGISGPGPWAAGLRARGIRHLVVPTLVRSWSPASDARAFADLLSLFRRERFDIVHTHNPKTGVFGRTAARLAGVPVVVNTVHGLYGVDRSGLRRTAYLAMERLAAACSDFEFCQSREDLDHLRALRIVRYDRSLHIGNGVDLAVFDPAAADRAAVRAALGIDDSTIVVGTVGRLVWEKGLREVFQTAERLRATRPNVRFLIVGPQDADKADAVPHDVIADLEGRGVIRFLGLRHDVRDLYRAMDIFVLASYREGMPRSAVEAAAMGLPMVLTDIRGCREVLTDGAGGFLVPPRDAPALEAAVRRLIDDAPLRRRCGEVNRQKALESFDERRIARQILEVYRRLLADKHGHAIDDLSQESVTGR